MKLVIWACCLFSLLGAEAWFLWPGEYWKFEWEPLLAFVAALSTFIAIERKNLGILSKIQGNREVFRRDRKQYAEIEMK